MGLLVAKTLSNATANPFLAGGTGSYNPVVALDVFLVQARGCSGLACRSPMLMIAGSELLTQSITGAQHSWHSRIHAGICSFSRKTT